MDNERWTVVETRNDITGRVRYVLRYTDPLFDGTTTYPTRHRFRWFAQRIARHNNYEGAWQISDVKEDNG